MKERRDRVLQGTEVHIIGWLNRPWGGFVDAFMLAVSVLGDFGIIWWVVCGTLALAKGAEGRRVASRVALGVLVAWAIDHLVRLAWFRPRPYMVLPHIRRMGRLWTNSSFPSGHASAAAAATAILLQWQRRIGAVAAAYTLLTCISRPYLGMHWPSDVLTGLCTGLLAGLLVLLVHKHWDQRGKPSGKHR